MKTAETAKAPEIPATDSARYVRWHLLPGRSGLIAAAVLIITGGIVFNWSWLVAAGFAPLILAVLSCAAMCALGLCANKLGARAEGSDAAKDATSRQSADTARTSHANPVEKG